MILRTMIVALLMFAAIARGQTWTYGPWEEYVYFGDSTGVIVKTAPTTTSDLHYDRWGNGGGEHATFTLDPGNDSGKDRRRIYCNGEFKGFQYGGSALEVIWSCTAGTINGGMYRPPSSPNDDVKIIAIVREVAGQTGSYLGEAQVRREWSKLRIFKVGVMMTGQGTVYHWEDGVEGEMIGDLVPGGLLECIVESTTLGMPGAVTDAAPNTNGSVTWQVVSLPAGCVPQNTVSFAVFIRGEGALRHRTDGNSVHVPGGSSVITVLTLTGAALAPYAAAAVELGFNTLSGYCSATDTRLTARSVLESVGHRDLDTVIAHSHGGDVAISSLSALSMTSGFNRPVGSSVNGSVDAAAAVALTDYSPVSWLKARIHILTSEGACQILFGTLGAPCYGGGDCGR